MAASQAIDAAVVTAIAAGEATRDVGGRGDTPACDWRAQGGPKSQWPPRSSLRAAACLRTAGSALAATFCEKR